METLFEIGSVLKGKRPYTDDEKRLLKDIFSILDYKDDTEENVAELRQLLTHLNLSFTNKDIEILYFFEDMGIRFSIANVFSKFSNKLNFLYAILDYELDMYRRIDENDVEHLRYFANFIHNLDYNRDRPVLQYLFEHGISPDISILRINRTFSHTLLYFSVDNHTSTEETEFLLSYGADPNNRNRNKTPAKLAIELNQEYPSNPIYIQILKLLLAYGGDYTGHEDNPVVQEFLEENEELRHVSNSHVGDNLDKIVSSYHRKNERMQFGKKEDECVIN
jgi:hypothetical protein